MPMTPLYMKNITLSHQFLTNSSNMVLHILYQHNQEKTKMWCKKTYFSKCDLINNV